ncbi:MAG: pyruvate carboxyltransferase [Pirellulales bacterium]|nr:pyruvate carboxyltransferase [Pirellulales bacterium]
MESTPRDAAGRLSGPKFPLLTKVVRQVERAMIWRHKWQGILFLSDTTLRDGEQMSGVRLNPEAKVTIAKALAAAGVHSIDAGSPAASREEVESIRRIVREVHGPVITAHCRTLPQDIDIVAEAFEEASRPRRGITVYIGVSPIHRERKHRKSKAEIIQIAVDAIQYAKRFFSIVTFGPEDAGRTEPEYLHEIYREAIAAGATTIGFADTVGILTPEKAADAIKAVQDHVPNIDDALLAVHFHNDLGLGTANALACVAQGVNIVQGTVNGIGERAGNTPLEEVAMAVKLHKDQYRRECHVDTRQLYELSRLVARLTGVEPAITKPIVGDNLFVTESGVHQDGLLKDPISYLPFLPEQTGAPPVRLVLGKHSGRRAVRYRMEQHGVQLDDQQVLQVLEHLKTGPKLMSYDSKTELDQLLDEVFHGTVKRNQ